MDNRKFNDQEIDRRNKLSELKKNNQDPFAIDTSDRN